MRGMTRPEMMIQASDAIDHVRSLVDSEVLIVFYTCTGVILTSRATVVAVVPATFPPTAQDPLYSTMCLRSARRGLPNGHA